METVLMWALAVPATIVLLLAMWGLFGGLFVVLSAIGYVVTWPFDRLVRAFDKDL